MTDAPPGPLIDLKALSEPACKLIDAVAGAIGVAYEPTRIRREAKAAADAGVIAARGRAKARSIELRATQRFMAREVRRQGNIESSEGVTEDDAE